MPREQNSRADILSMLTSTKRPGNNKSVILKTLSSPSIDQGEVSFLATERSSWMGAIISFLEDGQLPIDFDEAKKLRQEAAKYTILAGRLYKRGVSNPLL